MSEPVVSTTRRGPRFANTAHGARISGDQVPVPPPGVAPAAWLLDGRTGLGVRICLIDSGIEYSHDRITNIGSSYGVALNPAGRARVSEADHLDVVGHGTACASVISTVAPDARLDSVRVLGPANRGQATAFLTALEWAIGRAYNIVNLSLSTRKAEHRHRLLDLAETAAAAGVLLVCSAHNSPVESYPWTLASVISVGSHAGVNRYEIQMNPDPPVEFYAGGVNVDAAWIGGTTRILSGNSFATPAISATLARIVQGFPGLRPWQYKYLLSLLATNIRAANDD